MEWVSSFNRLAQGQLETVDGKPLQCSHALHSRKAAIHTRRMRP